MLLQLVAAPEKIGRHQSDAENWEPRGSSQLQARSERGNLNQGRQFLRMASHSVTRLFIPIGVNLAAGRLAGGGGGCSLWVIFRPGELDPAWGATALHLGHDTAYSTGNRAAQRITLDELLRRPSHSTTRLNWRAQDQ